MEYQGEILKGPYEFAIDITNKCNYRCKHCYNASGENVTIDEELSDEEFLEMIVNIAQSKPYNVCFCGGEPTLRLELLCQASEILHKYGTDYVSIVSNGFYWNDDLVLKLQNSHVNRVQISLDGASKEICYKLRQNKYAFERAVNALSLLKKYKFRETNIAFCPTKFNIDDFEKVCELCNELNVSEIRVQPLMLSGRARGYVEELLPSQEQYINLLRKIDQQNIKYSKIKINWGDPLDHLFRFKSGQNDIATISMIKANGDISISPYLPLSVGNIRKHSFLEYWDAGLPKIWHLDIAKKLADNLMCINDMGRHIEDVPDTWWENDIRIDIIEQKIFSI